VGVTRRLAAPGADVGAPKRAVNHAVTYLIHEDRYFSAGVATKLVRDGGQVSYDPPPGGSLPQGELVPVPVATDEPSGGKAEALAGARLSRRAVFDYFDQLPKA
jgi:hypothetical protein